MVLGVHLVVGAVLGRVVGNSPLAFVAGFLSHFLLDSIPHWDYPLRSKSDNPSDKLDVSMPINTNFAIDLAKIGLDLSLGFLVWSVSAKIFNWPFSPSLIWGALGGILPDFLQFAYFKLKWWPLRGLQRFHIWIHAEWRLDGHNILGPLCQLAVVLVVIILASRWF